MSTLTLRFGGLALFVHRTTPGKEGIVVLMPKDTSWLSWPHHKPQRVENEQRMELLTGDFRWTDCLGAAPTLTRVTNAARFTTLAKGARVPTRMFDPALPHEVAARFFLPYAPVVKTTTDTVRVRRDDNTNPAGYMTVAGTVDLEYQVTKQFDIGKKLTISPTQDRVVVIANVKSPKVKKGDYPIGRKIDHVDHYYHLLHGGDTPEIRTVDPYNNEKPRASGQMGAAYVNPVECIIGTGCEFGDPNCQD